MLFNNRLWLVIIASLFLLSTPVIAELPQISNARIIQPPPGAKVAAAYFDLTNPGSSELLVSGINSSIASKTELHLSKVENDIAKMIKQDQIAVPAGQTLQFKHGSYHVMFMGLHDALETGDTVDIVLQTNAGEFSVSIPVVSPDAASGSGHGSMKHDKKHSTELGSSHGMKHDSAD